MVLSNGLQDLPRGLKLVLHTQPGDDFSRRVEGFVADTSRRSGGAVSVGEGTGAILPEAHAGFTISSARRSNLHFLMVPERRELQPFLQALRLSGSDRLPIPAGLAERLARLRSPAEVWVLASVHCPNCPAAVEAVTVLAAATPLVSAYVIDAQVYPRIAEERGIQAVPAVVIDRELVLVGPLSAERLADFLMKRETGGYEAEICRSWILRRRTAEAARSLAQGRYHQAWVDLFQEPDLSVRMGVLVVLDRALQSNPESVRSMVPLWIPLLAHGDARIRGDVADFLGQTGDRRALPSLERLAGDPDPDVAEAAAGALEALRDRGD